MRQVFLTPDTQEPCSSGLADVPASAGHTISSHNTRLSRPHQGWPLPSVQESVEKSLFAGLSSVEFRDLWAEDITEDLTDHISGGAPQQQSSSACPASVCIPGDLCLGKTGQNLPMKRAFLSECLSPSWLPFSRRPCVRGACGGGRDFLLTGPAAVLPGDHPPPPSCVHSPRPMPTPGDPPRCPRAWAQGTDGPGGQGGEGGPGLPPNHWPTLLRSHYNKDSGPGSPGDGCGHVRNASRPRGCFRMWSEALAAF